MLILEDFTVTSAARVCKRFALHHLARGFNRHAITTETAINSAAFRASNPQLLIPNFPYAKKKPRPLIATVPKLEFVLTNWNDNLLTISNRNKKAIFPVSCCIYSKSDVARPPKGRSRCQTVAIASKPA
jgi:hypothetical protein